MARDISYQEAVLRLIARLADAAADQLAAHNVWDRDPDEVYQLVSNSLVEIDGLLDEVVAQASLLNRLHAVLLQHRRELVTERPSFVWDDEFSPDDPRWTDVRTAAERFNVDDSTLRKHIDLHGIGVKLGSGRRKRCYVSLRRARVFYSSNKFR